LQWFAPQFVCGDYEKFFAHRVSHVYHFEIPASRCLAEGNPTSSVTGPILIWSRENLVNFVLGYIVAVNVWFVRFGIDIEPDFHAPPHGSFDLVKPGTTCRVSQS
jgi:hypothetical protein